MKRHRFVALAAASAAALAPRLVRAADTVTLAIGQHGAWTWMIAQEGIDAGIFELLPPR